MVSIERTLLLWGLLPSFNVRSIGTLDAENFFGTFQDLDPTGSGVIRPKDIPQVFLTACELITAKFNPNRYLPCSLNTYIVANSIVLYTSYFKFHRGFGMHTTAGKVYPEHSTASASNKKNNQDGIADITQIREIVPK